MSSFERKLRKVFDKGGEHGPADDKNHRYVPRAIDGGPAWQVFDRKHDRFLTNREIKMLDEEALASEPLKAN